MADVSQLVVRLHLTGWPEKPEAYNVADDLAEVIRASLGEHGVGVLFSQVEDAGELPVTWEDVDCLRDLAQAIASQPTSVTDPEDAPAVFDLADRIASILAPPPGSGGA